MTQNSRKGAQAFATGNFNKGLNGVLGTINAGAQKVGKKMKRDKSRKGYNWHITTPTIVDGKSPIEYLKIMQEISHSRSEKVIIDSGDEIEAEKYIRDEAHTEGESYEEYVRRIASNYEYHKELGLFGGRNGSRKGSAIGAHGAFCDCPECGPAGHGSRPENLKEISTKIALGRNRSIGSPTAVEEEPTTEAPETQEEQTREGGFLRSVGKVVTNGVKVIGNGIHAAADELVDGGKDALNDKSTDFENVAGKIKNTPGGTSDEAAEKAGTPSGTQSAGNQDIASRVMNGEFGNGEARTKALTDAGYDPQEVQAQVNSKLKGSRKGSRKGETGDTDEAHLFIYLYEQDTTDDATLRNRWNALSNDEQEYILFQFGESRQEFESTFN